MLVVKFLRMFKIYLEHLDSKEVDEYSEFDPQSYINNSFMYCIYWTMCMGYLASYEHQHIETLLLRDCFQDPTGIDCISSFMLNEENEWLSWETLRE